MRKGTRVNKEVKLELIRDLARKTEFSHYLDFLRAFEKASTIFNIDGYTIGESTFKKDLPLAGITLDKDHIYRVIDEISPKKKLDNFWETFLNVTDMDSPVKFTHLFIKTVDGYSEYLAHEIKIMYGEEILGYSALRECLILYVTYDFAEVFNKDLSLRLNLASPPQE